MGVTPTVVPVSDLRKHTARLIEEVNRSGSPLFIAQRGYVTAVLLSHEEFECLRLQQGRPEEDFTGSADEPIQERTWPSSASIDVRRGEGESRSRRVRTQFGPCDYETARLLAEEGVMTELILTEDGWVLDDDEGSCRETEGELVHEPEEGVPAP